MFKAAESLDLNMLQSCSLASKNPYSIRNLCGDFKTAVFLLICWLLSTNAVLEL